MPEPPQKPTIDERLEILTINVKLLASSTRDLRATVEAQISRSHERDERDRQYLKAIADVLKHWANGDDTH